MARKSNNVVTVVDAIIDNTVENNIDTSVDTTVENNIVEDVLLLEHHQMVVEENVSEVETVEAKVEEVEIRKVGNGHLYKYVGEPVTTVAPQVKQLSNAAATFANSIFSLAELAAVAEKGHLKTRQDPMRIATYYRGTLLRAKVIVKVG